MMIFRNYKSVVALTVFLVIGGLAIGLSAAAASTDPLRIIVMNVRQGDSTLIITPQGKTMLIDAGQSGSKYAPYDAAQTTVIPMLESLGVKKIDVMVCTHPHEDHVGGLPAVMKKFPVGVLYDSGFDHTASNYQKMLELARDQKIPVKIPITGDLIPLCDSVTVRVLGPTLPVNRRFDTNPNNHSVVVRVEYGNFSFLNTGDAENELEGRIISTGARLKSTVLNTGHHGSRTATGAEFFALVDPEVAIISAGKRNRFDHPHWDTMSRLRRTGTRVMRTDYHGHIMVTSDGKTYQVNSTPVLESLSE